MASGAIDPMEQTFAARPNDASYWGPPLSPTRRAALLKALPGSVAQTLTALLDGKIVKGADRYAALPRCFKEVGYPELGTVATLLPERLTPEWRALLELSTALPRLIPSAYATPTDVWNLRRWLGLDPPGRLEQPVKPGGPPLWQQVAATEDRRWKVLLDLPLPERIEAFCEASLSAYRLSPPYLGELGDESLSTIAALRRLGDPGRTVAPAMADFLVRWRESPDWYGALRVPAEARLVVWLAAAAADVPFAPAWDRLYPLDWDREHELLERIPPERRVGAIEAGTVGVHPYYAEKELLRVLPKVPDPRIVALLKRIGRQGGGNPKRVIADELRRIADANPAVAELLGDAPAPKPHALTFRAVPMPPAGTPLPALLQKQVSIPEDSRHLYALFTAHDPAGKHLYDVSLFCWDDGPIYEAGTTKVVGRFVQGSAECRSAKLADALDTALHRFRAGEAPSTPAPRKQAAKKAAQTSAGKTPTAQRPAKRAATAQTSAKRKPTAPKPATDSGSKRRK